MINKHWHNKALEMRSQGFKSRAIAKEIFGRESAKSSINFFFKDYDNGLYTERVEKEQGYNVLAQKREKKILYFDIETSPEQGYVWGRFKANLAECQVTRHSHILTVAYAFNDEEIQGTRLTVEDVKNEDDLTAVVDLVKAINKADVIVSFNGKKFDMKMLRTRMIKWGLPPLRNVPHVDIYQMAKSLMKFPSNSMDNIAHYLGYSQLKIKTSFELWKRCLSVNTPDIAEEALIEMLRYNKGDIRLTRDLYKRFQGWTTGVNIGTIVNNITPENVTLRCAKCGSDDVFVEDGMYSYTQTKGFQLYRCGNSECRGVSRISGNGKSLIGV